MSIQPKSSSIIHVLVIDDDEVDRERIERELVHYSDHYLVHEADSLEKGVELCQLREIDVVILDTTLQTTTGLETLRLFRSKVPSIPIVLVSGTADEELALMSIQSGAEDFINKDGFEKRWFQIVLQNAIHRHRLKQQLTDQSKSLEQANHALRQFTYVSSHELQEPLRAVQGFGQKLRSESGDDLNDQCKGYVDRMMDGAQRMHRLINDLLDYSKHTIDGSYDFQTVDLDGCVKDACRNLYASIDECGAEVKVEKLPKILGVRSMLTQLFQNMIGNALKYRRQEETPVISIRATSCESEVKIDIEDNGIGIKEQYQEQIFGLFKRLHRREEFPGTGIGLAICSRVLELHDGRISVNSTPGSGSTFSIHFPIVRLVTA